MVIFSFNMSSLNTPTLPIARPPRKPRKCGICGASGHDKRNCPSRPAATAVSVVQNGPGGQNVTSNALVLYNEQLKLRTEEGPTKKLNISQFKMQLVVDLVGKPITDLSDGACEHPQEHVAIPIENNVRSRCTYCALMSRTRRTRYQCVVCGVPLCAMGSGKVENDCFSQAHETEDRRQMVLNKYSEMQRKNNNPKKIIEDH